ncbi:hypothetical protein [Streptomyces mirabilis]
MPPAVAASALAVAASAARRRGVRGSLWRPPRHRLRPPLTARSS